MTDDSEKLNYKMAAKNSGSVLLMRYTLTISLALLAPFSFALAQDAHEHGVAELNVVRESQQIQIEFVSPVANLLGFERMPESAEEWTLFATVVEELASNDWLIGETLSECTLTVQAQELPSFASSQDEHGHDHAEDDGHDHEEEAAESAHVDFRMQYLFDCPGAVPSQLQIVAFQHYPAIERIDTQWIIERSPGFSQLTPDSPGLALD